MSYQYGRDHLRKSFISVAFYSLSVRNSGEEVIICVLIAFGIYTTADVSPLNKISSSQKCSVLFFGHWFFDDLMKYVCMGQMCDHKTRRTATPTPPR